MASVNRFALAVRFDPIEIASRRFQVSTASPCRPISLSPRQFLPLPLFNLASLSRNCSRS